MVTGNQLRIARFALRWSVQRLSDETGVPLRTVKRIEAEDSIPSTSASTVHTLQAALESAGIEFIGSPDDGPGIRIRTSPPKP
jgi:transcriptional regulator with XRE-family HTH domain